MQALARAYVKNDMTLAEINPLVLTRTTTSSHSTRRSTSTTTRCPQ